MILLDAVGMEKTLWVLYAQSETPFCRLGNGDALVLLGTEGMTLGSLGAHEPISLRLACYHSAKYYDLLFLHVILSLE
jgi:hypothetical protein